MGDTIAHVFSGSLAKVLLLMKFAPPMHSTVHGTLLFVFLWFSPAVTVARATEFPVALDGAAADGSSPATAAIQAAIDQCAKAGGGTVVVPAGRYLCSTVELRSGVELRLETGAVLLASRDSDAYPGPGRPVLLRGDGLENVAITGAGTIDGRAEHEWRTEKEVDGFIRLETENARRAGIEMKRAFAKPPKTSLVMLRNCRKVRLTGFSALRSPHWGVHLAACHEVTIAGLRIESSLTEGVNSDGLDIDGCSQVTVRGCRIATGDDAICLKSTTAGAGGAPCEDIVVENCELTSTSCALKIGTEGVGDFRRIVFRDCRIRDSNRGLGIFVRDGATVSDVLFSNISIECNRKHYHWWGDGDPLRFVVLKRKPETKAGQIENLRVEKVTARGQGTSLIAGFGAKREADGITLRDVSITLEAEGKPDKRATDALVIRDARNIRLEKLKIGWDEAKGREPKWASGLRAERVEGLELEQCQIDAAPGSGAPPIRAVDLDPAIDDDFTQRPDL